MIRSEEGNFAEALLDRPQGLIEIGSGVLRGDGEAEPAGPRRDGGGTDPLTEDPKLEESLAQFHGSLPLVRHDRQDVGHTRLRREA